MIYASRVFALIGEIPACQSLVPISRYNITGVCVRIAIRGSAIEDWRIGDGYKRDALSFNVGFSDPHYLRLAKDFLRSALRREGIGELYLISYGCG